MRDAAEVARLAGAATGLAGTPVWLAAYGSGALVALHLAAQGEVAVAGAVLAAPTSGEPLLRRAPGYTLADLLAVLPARRAAVLDPSWDPEGARGAVAAACRAAGVEHRPVADWHRLSGPTRAAMAAWLDAAGPMPLSSAA